MGIYGWCLQSIAINGSEYILGLVHQVFLITAGLPTGTNFSTVQTSKKPLRLRIISRIRSWSQKIDQQMTGWWFGTIFIFPYIGNSNPNWRTHIFQRGSYTTNQMMFLVMAKLKHRPCEEIAQRVPVLMWIPDAWNPWNPGWILTTKPHTTSVPPVYHLS